MSEMSVFDRKLHMAALNRVESQDRKAREDVSQVLVQYYGDDARCALAIRSVVDSLLAEQGKSIAERVYKEHEKMADNLLKAGDVLKIVE